MIGDQSKLQEEWFRMRGNGGWRWLRGVNWEGSWEECKSREAKMDEKGGRKMEARSRLRVQKRYLDERKMFRVLWVSER